MGRERIGNLFRQTQQNERKEEHREQREEEIFPTFQKTFLT